MISSCFTLTHSTLINREIPAAYYFKLSRPGSGSGSGSIEGPLCCPSPGDAVQCRGLQCVPWDCSVECSPGAHSFLLVHKDASGAPYWVSSEMAVPLQ